ncbi:TetR family transcriptional regulator [Longispora urticae]
MVNLGERKRQLVRDELSHAALRLLAHQGFEETTVDEITEAAGVSRRTFFRYFRSKEDVIIELLGDLGSAVSVHLAARPATEAPAPALRAALALVLDEISTHPEKSLGLTRIILGTPALRARYLTAQDQWRASLAAELGTRTGLDPTTDLRPVLAAGVALVALDVTLDRWAQLDGAHNLVELLDEAYEALAAH